jgi:hypothetical protein
LVASCERALTTLRQKHRERTAHKKFSWQEPPF